MFSARKTAEIKICGLSITQSSNGVLKTATPPPDDKPLFSELLPYLTAQQLNSICPIGGNTKLNN
ncbi:MAG: hypothetical protein CMO80_15030 [Verrucomicrobiales bacterium]|nr:hypothetical protein [Verrucomicrobiales bacterium]